MDCMRDGFLDGVLLDGRFRTTSPLNHGSFGMVFKARDTFTGEAVALKCLTKATAANFCPTAFAIDDRSEELTIHRRIGHHPNIVNLIHSFETPHHVYLVLEFCPNGDLYEAIRLGKGPLETEHMREFMLQLVDAVEFMHSKSIYHRDIKPENVFLTKAGTVKLGDFGLATMEQWTFEAAVGSDRYMAPEQFEPSTTGYSPQKADVWAIGICLLNILFSRNPFATPTASDPLFADFCGDRQTLFDVFPNMSQDTFEVLAHCLAIDPDKRSLAAVKEALVRVVSFTTDEEALDDFCTEQPVNVTASANREPLRTPSLNTSHGDVGGAFPWAKALAMSPPQPVRQLSAIPDTESYSEDLFPRSERSNRSGEWFSDKPESASVASFADSGFGHSFNSSNLALPESARFMRSNPVPISGSLPTSATRPKPISSISQIFKKRDLVSKSWSDLWDEEEEQVRMGNEGENMFVQRRNWEDDHSSTGRSTPRVGLIELNPETSYNSRDRTPQAQVADERVSEHTGFLFEDFHPPATPTAARYSPPPKRIIADKWSALGDRRRAPTPRASPAPMKTARPSPSSSDTRKRSRAGSWRRPSLAWVQSGSDSGVWERKERDWNSSKDWRQQGNGSAESLGGIEWVWRHDLHL